MWYVGGKIRLSKYIVPIIQSKIEEKPFIDIFCGGCNVIDKISSPKRIANDNNEYLIEMWKSLQSGWIPSDMDYSKDFYLQVKNNKNSFEKSLVGLVGFHYSYGGKFFGGYARSRYLDHIERNIKHTIKQINKLKNVVFTNLDYREYSDIKECVIYADPPYYETTQESTRYNQKFDHKEFWKWVNHMSLTNVVFVSECTYPKNSVVVWKKEHNSNMSYNAKTRTNETLLLYE